MLCINSPGAAAGDSGLGVVTGAGVGGGMREMRRLSMVMIVSVLDLTIISEDLDTNNADDEQILNIGIQMVIIYVE